MKRNVWKRAALIAGITVLLTGCGEAKKAYDKGMELAKAGKYEKSLPYFKDAIKENGEQAEYYIGYGMALCRLNRYELAKEEFQKVIQETDNKISKENNKQLCYGMAIADYGLGDYGSVTEYCDKALEIEYLDDMDCDILYTKMSAYWQQGEWKKAEEACQELLKKNKKYMDAYMALAGIEQNLGESDKAAQAYKDVIETDKTYYDAYFKLYQQYMAAGQTDAANELLDQLVAIKPNKAENMMVIGRAYFYKQEYDRAKEYLKMAYDGNNKESLYYSGALSAALEQYDDAIMYYQKYIKENKEELNVEVYYQLALVYMQQKEYDKAQSMITKGISYGITAALQELKKTQVILLEKQNCYEEAVPLAEEYIRCYPADVAMEKELAFIKTRMK
jgi:Predicted N-acetylglucosaminyl transferase